MFKRLALLSVLFTNSVFAASGLDKFTAIIDFLNSTAIKSIGGLLICGIAIFLAKNHNRLAEVGWSAISWIIAILLITNCKTVINWFL